MEIDGRLYIWTPLSCRQYRVMLEDAECEYERSLHRSNTPIYSFRTLMNPEKFQRLKLLNHLRMDLAGKGEIPLPL